MDSILIAIIHGEGWKLSSVRNLVLRKNFRRLGRAFCRSNSITDDLRVSCAQLLLVVVERSDLLQVDHALGRHLVTALLRVAAYSDRWIRTPEDWEPEGDDLWMSLLNHLFVRWELPDFFRSAWLTKGTLRHLERDWFCEVANGLNWRKLERVPKSVSKRAVHFAMKAPADLKPRQALRWGQLRSLGASNDLIGEVLRSCVVNNLSNDEIWFRLFEKMVGDENFDSGDFGLVADVFEGLYRKWQFSRARELVGLPLRELLNHCRQYWRILLKDAVTDGLKFRIDDIREAGLRRNLQHFTNAVWEPMESVEDLELRHRTRKGMISSWEIVQLTRHSQLVVEGLTMNHCVGGYRRNCQQESSAIFSVGEIMEEGGCRRVERRVTVEVYPKGRFVVQARRRWNDDPGEIEKEVIGKWARRNGIRY